MKECVNGTEYIVYYQISDESELCRGGWHIALNYAEQPVTYHHKKDALRFVMQQKRIFNDRYKYQILKVVKSII